MRTRRDRAARARPRPARRDEPRRCDSRRRWPSVSSPRPSRSSAPLRTTAAAWNGFAAERRNTGGSSSRGPTALGPEIANRTRCKLSIRSPRRTSTRARRIRGHPSACSRSAIKSTVDSTPTESRMSPSAMPRRRRSSGAMPEWDVVAGPGDEAFDAAEARRRDRQLDPLEHTVRRRDAAAELEREHAAEAVEQAPRALVLRVAFEPGIAHLRDRGVALEELSDGERARVLLAHADAERLHAAVKQERGVWIERAAEVPELEVGGFAPACGARSARLRRCRRVRSCTWCSCEGRDRSRAPAGGS